MKSSIRGSDLPRFSRDFFGAGEDFSCIGQGPVGGKAAGLLQARELVSSRLTGRFLPFQVSIPRMAVVCTDVFEAFLERNGLRALVESETSDVRIAHAFQQAALPAEVVGDLRGLVERVKSPLAVRSSSLLEDALHTPFAGVYETKMIPNSALDVDLRFRKLSEALKFVWATTFFRHARDYLRATGRPAQEERMGVIVQEVVGHRYGPRYYPELSGVARSVNYYPVGSARAEDGVLSLALGLGKTIVDGGRCWSVSPARPAAAPPFASAADRVTQTQSEFWAVHMGPPPEHDPIRETEFMVLANVADAEADGALALVASTYDAQTDRLLPGLGRAGPRVIDFAPLLVYEELPLMELVRGLIAAGEEALGGPVEIEFAATLPGRRGDPARLGFLQVRAMAVADQEVEVAPEELCAPEVLLCSTAAMGNGRDESLRDVIYVLPERFEARNTPQLALEIESLNRELGEAGRPYLLIGIGRWGSSDPWLGIPVEWSQISGARVIVEVALPALAAEPSQGSHFFHNMISFGVSYLSVPLGARPGVDWDWLNRQEVVRETAGVRHVRLARPLLVKVDGRCGRAVVRRGE